MPEGLSQQQVGRAGRTGTWGLLLIPLNLDMLAAQDLLSQAPGHPVHPPGFSTGFWSSS